LKPKNNIDAKQQNIPFHTPTERDHHHNILLLSKALGPLWCCRLGFFRNNKYFIRLLKLSGTVEFSELPRCLITKNLHFSAETRVQHQSRKLGIMSSGEKDANTSTDISDVDDDFIPESLADFVKQANATLSEHQQMFLDELSPPAVAQDTTGETTEGDKSALLDDIASEMKKITIVDDEHKQKVREENLSNVSDELRGKAALAPASDLAKINKVDEGALDEGKRAFQFESGCCFPETSIHASSSHEAPSAVDQIQNGDDSHASSQGAKSEIELSVDVTDPQTRSSHENPSENIFADLTDPPQQTPQKLNSPCEQDQVEDGQQASPHASRSLSNSSIRLHIEGDTQKHLSLNSETNILQEHQTCNSDGASDQSGKPDVIISITTSKPDLQLELKTSTSKDSSLDSSMDIPIVTVSTPNKLSGEVVTMKEPLAASPLKELFSLADAMQDMKISSSSTSQMATGHQTQSPRVSRISPPVVRAKTTGRLTNPAKTAAKKKSQPTKPSPRTPASSSVSVKRSPAASLPTNTTSNFSRISRLVQPTAASRGRSAALAKSTSSKVPAKSLPRESTSRFVQPTAAKRAHLSQSPLSSSQPPSRSSVSRTKVTVPKVSSRLMKGTAASAARQSSTPYQPSLPQKRTVPADDVVARAKERVRQRREQQMLGSSETKATFSIGTKGKTNQKHRQSASKVSTRSRLPTASNSTPHFAAATESFARTIKIREASSAQKSDSFGRGLRGGTAPRLTVPEEPKFATTARYGNKKVGHQIKAPDVTLAQSTNILAKTLRGDSSVSSTKRNTKLTQPQSPKFHRTHKRPLPKSTAEREQEVMEHYRSHPFKANPKANLHTGSSAGLMKVPKRRLTTPEPFNLSLASRPAKAVDSEATQSSKDAADLEECKKKFRARPLPSFSSPPAVSNKPEPKTKRSVTKPEPFNLHFAGDLKTKHGEPSPRKPGSSKTPKFKARPVPKTTFENPAIPVQHVSSSPNTGEPSKPRSTTKPAPFHLQTDRRHEAHKKQLEQRLKSEEEERKRQMFHARPYKMSPAPQSTLGTQSKATRPEPFKLQSVQRHEAFQELFEQKVAAEEEEFKKRLVPKAIPLPETTYSPYNPSSTKTDTDGQSALHESDTADAQQEAK
jgi:hypothetical protein